MIQFAYQDFGRSAARTQSRQLRSREDHRFAPFVIRPRNRFWELNDGLGNLVCVTVYKRGAVEVARRLKGKSAE